MSKRFIPKFTLFAVGFSVISTLIIPIPAKAATEPVSLTVQSFNVCKGGPDGTPAACAAPAPSWTIRRERVANVVSAAQAEVIGFQEVTNHPTPNGAPTQREDMTALLANIGYAVPQYDNQGQENSCRRPRDESGKLSGPSPCENTSSLAYNSSTVSQATSPNGAPTAGLAISQEIHPNIDPTGISRSVAWAFLSKEGKVFLAVSAHTSNTKTPEAEEGRKNFASGLTGWTAQLSESRGFPTTTPVILLADLNSYQKRNPQGAQTVLTQTGWSDAFNAPVKKNIRYSTVNYTADVKKLKGDLPGFPRKPITARKTRANPLGAATRIDYIMGRNGVQFETYEVLIWLNPDGTFNQNYQASDHQSIKATATLL